MHKTLVLAVLVPMLAACSLTPTYERPEVPVPAQWDGTSAAAALATDARWWRRYGSAELDALMDEALARNHDLAVAVERIAQARASARSARASLFPEAGASASASRSRQRSDEATQTSDDGRATLSVGYELDLWGANRAAADAAGARLAASVYDRAAVELVLQSEVATTYFQLLALQDRLVIAQENLAAARQLMALVEVRFDNGAVTALDVAQQRTTLLAIEAQIPALELSLDETRHALAVLLARAPQGFAVAGRSLAELRLPDVDAGQPAALLVRRPDIRGAEARLLAAHADVGAARAALFPSLELSASAGVAGLLDGGSTTVASVAASLAQSIFDGGRRRAQIALNEAQRRELVESYAQTVLTSLREAEDGLSALAAQRRRAELLAETALQAREAYRLARIRFDEGATDLLTLLDTQRSQLSAEDSRVQAELARYTASAQLFKALGGGWAEAGRRAS